MRKKYFKATKGRSAGSPPYTMNDMKKAGNDNRLMQGLNKDTGVIEQIYNDTACKTALRDTEGNFINEDWEHIYVDEYVDAAVVNAVPTAEAATMAPSLD